MVKKLTEKFKEVKLNNLLGNTEEVTKNKNVIKDIIIIRVDKKYHLKIIGLKEPAQILETLKDLRKTESNLNIHTIRRDLYNMKIKPKETISDFSRRFDELIVLYESCEPKQPLTDSDNASAFYIGTCERYPELRAAINLSNIKLHEEMNIEEIKSILLQAEKDKAKPDQVPTQAVRVAPAREHANHERCFRCDKAGHLHRYCPLRSQNLYFCFGCKKVVDHKTYNCPEVEKKRYVDKDLNGGGHGRGGGGGKMRGRGGRGGRGRGERGKPYARGNEKQKKGECFYTYSNIISRDPKNIEFIADSGATEHIISNGLILENFEKCGGEIKCANSDKNANLSIDGRGTLVLKSIIDDRELKLSDVIVAPNISENLISLRKFVELGYCIYLDDESLLISDKSTGDTFLMGVYERPNWILTFDIVDSRATSKSVDLYRAGARIVSLEHFEKQALTITDVENVESSLTKLGRENLQKSQKVENEELPIKRQVLNLNKPVEEIELEKFTKYEIEIDDNKNKVIPSSGMLWYIRLGLRNLCARENGKIPFKNNRDRSDRSLHKIHTDTMGPISPTSFPDHNRFIIVFINDYSRYAKVYCVRNKSESGDCLEDFIQHIRNLSDSKERICYIRADNGTEFTGGKFEEIMKKEGISKDFAPPYTPELNGTAERFNKTIQKKIRALMIDAGLPSTMWELAANPATYIYIYIYMFESIFQAFRFPGLSKYTGANSRLSWNWNISFPGMPGIKYTFSRHIWN
ncbi:hypothetical protein TKK_0000209 [Trichogramma kaykai]